MAHRGKLIGAAALVVLTVAALQASAAFATFPGANGRIAYSYRLHCCSGSIFTMNPDGTELERLTAGFNPSWSADGRLIAFNRQPRLDGRVTTWVMRADGTHKRRIADGVAPSFSPDRRRIVFSDRSGIATIRIDGTGYKTLAGEGDEPKYSPDGEHIVYRKPFVRSGLRASSIWLMRSDGSHERRVTRSPEDAGPDFRPDGRRIIFCRCGQPDPRGGCVYDTAKIVALDGSHITGLACAGAGAVYSPDGVSVADSRLFGQTPDLSFLGSNIWTRKVVAPCRTDHPLTHYAQYPGRGFAASPSWQPLPNG